MKTIDLKFNDLCNEIDYWKDEANYFKSLYEELMKENAIQLNNSLAQSRKGVANALIFALSVKDNEDGSLSISKEDRNHLAESL